MIKSNPKISIFFSGSLQLIYDLQNVQVHQVSSSTTYMLKDPIFTKNEKALKPRSRLASAAI